MEEKQICKICSIEKPIYHFGKKEKFRYRKECKECWNRQQRGYNKLSEEEKINLKGESTEREKQRKLEYIKRKEEKKIEKENKKKLKHERLVVEYEERMRVKLQKRELRLKNYLCSECGDTEVGNFYPTRKNKCKKCLLANSNKYYKYDKMTEGEKRVYMEKRKSWVADNIIKVRVLAAKHRAIKKNIPFEISEEIILKKLEDQEGKCYISKQPLSLNQYSWYSLSLDRLNSSSGYTVNNTILVTKFVNSSKNELLLDEYVKLLKEVCDNFGG